MLTPENACLCCFKELNEAKGVCPYCGCDNSAVANESHQLECGSILAGTYLIGKVLGQGGFGITYVAWDLNLDIKVAIKEYYPEGCVTRDTHTHITVLTYAGAKDVFFQKGKEKFVGEARALAKFSGDSGVVGVRAFFYENGTAYIVMDFVEGETLKSYAARMGGKLPSARVLALFQPLIRSLTHVHENGLLHRDISPDNIMLRPDGTLALLDFGAARQMSVAGEHSNTINVKHGFAPEEQYRTRGEQGPWTDVYALCATIYRLTTGVTPTEALDRMANDEPLAPPNKLGADFTVDQQQALLHGLAVRAERRTRDLHILMQELYGTQAAAQPQRVPTPQAAAREPAAAPVPLTPISAVPVNRDPADEPARGASASQSGERGEMDGGKSGKPKKPISLAAIALTIVVIPVLFVVIALITDSSNDTNTSSAAYVQAATSVPGATEAPGAVVNAQPAATQAPTIAVDWQDPLLETRIRDSLGKTNGETITTDDLAAITNLSIAGDTIVVNDESFWAYVDNYSNTYSVDGGTTMLPIPKQTISLSDLQYFYGLQSLSVMATSVTDAEALSSCHELITLTLDTCGQVDLNWLNGCQNLTYLMVRNCDSVVLTGAGADSSINDMTIENCGTVSGTELAEFSRLTSLSVWGGPLINPDALGTLTNLSYLGLNGTGIQNVDFITNMKGLLSLNLGESGVSALPSLDQLSNLTSLYLPYCDLDDADMQQLASHTNLQSLLLDGCDISDLSFATNLTKLDYLSFDGTSVKDLSPIKNLTRLTTLWMRDTKITDISILSDFHLLKTLGIGGSKIKDYSPIAALNLNTFYVDSSQEKTIRDMFPNAEINVW